MKSTRRAAIRGLVCSSLVPPSFLGRQCDILLAAGSDHAGSDRFAAQRPEDIPRMEICLNGDWQTIENSPSERTPASGWVVQRVPAMPLATNPPVTSVWYRHRMHVPASWKNAGRRFFLRLGKAGHYAAIYCNGRMVGEHYGQYTPFEADVTDALRAGDFNEIAIYVHNASGKYVRPGAMLTDPMEDNAYRAATIQEYERNWTGIVGNIFFGWRPASRTSDIFVIPSVRNHRVKVELKIEDVDRDTAGLTVRSVVLDDGKVVRRLPAKAIDGNGPVSLEVDWTDPVLWGPEPYGKPKLYVLRTDLMRRGKLVDRSFTRFGFREVWIEGRDVLLNGKKLWMSGTYFKKLAPIRYLNDRHPQSVMIEIMQKAGLNTLHGHWDDLGETWLDQCDETGMMVLGGFFCDGRPDIQSKADPGWVDWMAATCGEWVRSVRNHPSIVMWRPTDVIPENLSGPTGMSAAIAARMAEQVRREDGTRPLADGSDILGWAQGSLKNQEGQLSHGSAKEFDDGSTMAQALASSKKPFLTKEIYTYFPTDAGEIKGLKQFLRDYYAKAYAGGGIGIIVQHIPLTEWDKAFRVLWLSESGEGNRNNGPHVEEENLPNWCDPSRPMWIPTPYNELFAELYRELMKLSPVAARGERLGEILLSGLDENEMAILMPDDPEVKSAIGMRAAQDGTAWIVGLDPGQYRLFAHRKLLALHVDAQDLPNKAGYPLVQRFSTTSSGPAVNAKALSSPRV